MNTMNRTGADARPAAWRFGRCLYAPAERRLYSGDEAIALEPRLADLLDIFLRHPGETLQREHLIDAVWGESGSDEALTQAVSRLRKAVGDGVIRTAPRLGYRFDRTPRLAEAPRPPLPASPEHKRSETRRRRTILSLDLPSLAIGAGLGAAIAAGAFLMLVEREIVIQEIETIDGVETASTRQVSCGLLSECEAGAN